MGVIIGRVVIAELELGFELALLGVVLLVPADGVETAAHGLSVVAAHKAGSGQGGDVSKGEVDGSLGGSKGVCGSDGIGGGGGGLSSAGNGSGDAIDDHALREWGIDSDGTVNGVGAHRESVNSYSNRNDLAAEAIVDVGGNVVD